MADFSDVRNCPICRDEIDFYSYGACDHPTCLRCAVKIRKFGSADEPDFSKCATCRSRLNRIVLMKHFKPFEQVDLSNLRQDMECDFFFEDVEVELFYKKMLSCECTKCGHVAQSMSALNRHATALHNLSYCDLCLRHARLLPCEFIAMTPSELSEHRKWNKAKKRGHPMCEFCNRTFYEFEDLVKHIRESHFLCDFCNAAAIFVVFYKQHELFDHYKEAHFVCPECDAKGRTTCFASCDQLGLHRLHEHPRESENDPGRWDPVQIRYSNQGLIGQLGRVGGRNRSAHRLADETSTTQPDRQNPTLFQPRSARPEEWTGADFPTLDRSRASNDSNLPPQPLPSSESSNTPSTKTHSMASILGSGRIISTDTNEFPSLPSNSPTGDGNSAQTRLIKNWAPKTSPCGMDSSLKKVANVTPTGEDFPSLNIKGNAKPSNPLTTNWGRKQQNDAYSAGPVSTDMSTRVSSKQVVPKKSDFPSLQIDLQTSSPLSKPVFPSYRQPVEKTLSKKKILQNNLKFMEENAIKSVMATLPKNVLPQVRSGKHSQRKEDALNEQIHDEAAEQAALNHIRTIDSNTHPLHCQTPSIPSAKPNFTTEEFPDLTSKAPASGNPKKKKDINLHEGGAKNSPHSSAQNTGNQIEAQKSKTNSIKNEVLSGLEDTETVLFSKSVFTAPPDFDAKNLELIQQAEEALSQAGVKNSFTRFADLSRLYRYGHLSANSYVQGLDSILGALRETNSGNKLDWLCCMIELLPDVGRQRALLRALQGTAAPRVPNTSAPNRAQACSPPIWSKTVLGKLTICADCGQVCLRSTLKEHSSQAHS